MMTTGKKTPLFGKFPGWAAPALVAAIVLATAVQTFFIYRASARMWQPTYIISQPSLSGAAAGHDVKDAPLMEPRERPVLKNEEQARAASDERRKADERENLMRTRGEMEKIFEAALNALTAPQDGAAPDFHPPGDMFGDGQLLVAHVDIPGADPDSLQASLSGDRLLVSGRTSPIPGGDKNRRTELRRGSFQREFALPFVVDAEKGAAEYRNGVLIVKVPKSDGENSKKTVKLKVSVEKR